MEETMSEKSRRIRYPPKSSLSALPEADYEGLCQTLELVSLPLGMAVYESGGKLDHVYSPPTASFRSLRLGRRCIGGNRGRGTRRPRRHRAFHGGNPRRAGRGAKRRHRVPASVENPKKEFERNGPLQHLLLRYTRR